jgi:tRNA1Val (adenine37-N6)-methyltransferase
MKNIFRFKQFEIDQTGCAMRINTDGVLLGAIAEGKNAARILDVGAGTGVIALMLAQRFPKAWVEAVEIDQSAAETAARNFRNAKFASRLLINNLAIEQYNNDEKFDLIISNPPFFVNDLKNIEEKKGLARHTDEVFFREFAAKANELLSTSGYFWFILPVKQSILLTELAEPYGLFIHRIVHLHSDSSKQEFRRIVALGRDKIKPVVTNFYIYETQKVYTKAYKELLKDFFLEY